MDRRRALLLLPLLAVAACSSTDPPESTPAQPSAGVSPTARHGPSTATTGAAPAAPAPDLATWTPQTPAPGAAGQPRGLDLDLNQVDTGDALAVAEAFAVAMLTPDARLDRSPSDVTRRAAVLAGEPFASQLAEARASTGGQEWVALGEREGYLSVQLHTHPAVEAGLITDGETDLVADVPILATVTAHDADLPDRDLALLVSVQRATPGAPWQVFDWHQEGAR